MAVINILKDGTIVEDMSTVTVPVEIMIAVKKIVERSNNNGNGKDSNSQSA